jgi:UDP-N-acetylglucosamine enolpyruvyl transferase
MYKFKEGKLSMIERTNNDVTEEAIAASAAAESENVVENAAANAEAADAAFGV